MNKDAEAFKEAFLKLADKHGIGSFCMVFHDPDGDSDACILSGESAWARGATALLADLAIDQQYEAMECDHGNAD